MRWLSSTVLLTVVLFAVAASASAAPRATLSDIEDEVMCMTCGTALSLSESPGAQRQRALIQRLINRGLDKAQIKTRLVDEFGPQVLATPPRRGFTLTAYLVPLTAMIIAVGAVLLAGLRRTRRSPCPTIDPAVQDDFAQLVDDDVAGLGR